MKKTAQSAAWWILAAVVGAVLPGCPPNSYKTLTISVTPAQTGTVQVDPNLSAYPPRTEVTLEAIPDKGWVFSNWIGNGFNTSTAVTKLVMNKDQAVTAVFSPESGAEGEGEIEGEPPANKVQDGGFEQGPENSAWTQTSAIYETIVCDAIQCGLLNGMGPYNGRYWAYFGNLDGRAELARLEQALTMPSQGDAVLAFRLAVPAAELPFQFQAAIIPAASPSEPAVLFEINQTHASVFSTYQMVEVDVSAYANGGAYTLRFGFTCDAGDSSARAAVFLDNVSINSNT